MKAATGVDHRLRFYVVLVIAVLLLPALLGSSQSIFNDGDVSWHIATGQWILDHRTIPRIDPFSFTWAGKPWVPIEWLAEVIMAAAYRLAGYSGISALATGALITLHGVIFFNAARFARPLTALGGLIAMDIVLIPMTLARPHLLAWALLAFWVQLLLTARRQDRVPRLPWALLITVWANLHGSFAMGLVVAAAMGLEALIVSADRARSLRQWGSFGLACAVAVFINGNGLDGVLHPLRIANLSMLPLIDEWKPSQPSVTPFFFVVLIGTLALIWVKRPRMHWVRWMLLVALMGLALLQVRHQAVLAIVSAMVLPEAFAKDRVNLPTGKVDWLPITAAAMVLLGIRLCVPMTLPETEANPWRLIAAVPPELRSQPVLNGYVMGGPLILSGVRTYVDGRGDMYGDELVINYKRITEGDAAALDEAVRKWNLRWAILPSRYKTLVALLDQSPDWKKIREDEAGAIYVRS